MVFHPWRRLRSLTGVDLVWRPLTGMLGATDGATVIYMDPVQLQVERRCTVAHEQAHIELGHTRGHHPDDERTATQLAARWLVEMPAILDALRWSEELEEVADQLWVDLPTLMARLDGLTSEERQ